MMTGSDVLNVQQMLADDGYSCPVNGIFDEATKNAVKMFQSKNGISHINGVVDQETYNAMINKGELPEGIIYYGNVINKSGAHVYASPDYGSNIVDSLVYGDIIPVYDINGDYLVTLNGYVLADNVWTPDNAKVSTKGYTNLKIGDEGPDVRLLQNSLKDLGILKNVTGTYDAQTREAIDLFQLSRSLTRTGIADQATWEILHEAVAKLKNPEVGFKQDYAKQPGRYIIKRNNVFEDISHFTVTITTNEKITVKRTCNVWYSDKYIGFLSITNECNTGDELTLQDMSDAFSYNIYHGEPQMVEYVVYPYGRTPHKFIFTFE